MNWYLTKLVYRIISGTNSDDAQFDEQLRLIQAGSKEEAFHKAQITGVREEEIFMNTNQQLVEWKFINVAELYKLGEMIDGAELYSRIEERGNADAYIETINRKAAGILQSDTHQILQLL
jgi:Domain of unknown function (DUF4288)